MSDSRRLFYALWPPAEVAAAIAHQRHIHRIPGRPVSQERLHLTLAFLGEIAPDTIDKLITATAGVPLPAFTLQLAPLGYFRRPGIAWLGPVGQPPELLQLVSHVAAAANIAGLDMPECGFRPHVTLARKASAPRPSHIAQPIQWDVCHFALTESLSTDAGSKYRDIGRWQLADSGAPTCCATCVK